MSKNTSDTAAAGAKAAGRPKACDVETRTHELIETAARLFLKHGYTRVSLEAIAREAHVAVRTIYVKFGGKAGLLNAVMVSRRDRFFRTDDMDCDLRPFRQVVDDFARRLLELLSATEPISLQRVVIAEAPSNPELAETFYEAGPKITRDMLERFFARADIRAQLRDDLPFEQLPALLINCISGDVLGRLLSPQRVVPPEEMQQQLEGRLGLFYRSVLRAP